MVCTNCQKEIADGSNFCYNCGAKQSTAGTAANAVPCPPRRRLVPSTTDKKIAGVAAALADYFDLDPTIIRLVWLLAFFCRRPAPLPHLLLWLALPPPPPEPA